MKTRMVTSKLLAMCILALMLGFSPAAHATLVDNGGGLIYDTNLNITWYDAPAELRLWNNSMTWVAGLTMGNTDAGSWRLPTTPGTTYPFSATYTQEGEMGYLYYTELGNSAGGPLVHKSYFTNLQPDYYWTSTLLYQEESITAWMFNFGNGKQIVDNGAYWYHYVLPVHAGNVPEPATIGLLGLGVLGLLKKRRA